MMRTLRHALFALPLLALASGCGGPSTWFYAQIKEPGICKTLPNQVMDPTAPGANLVLRFTVNFPQNIPLFSTADGGTGQVQIYPISVTFDAKSGIQDFNSVDSAWITAIPDPANTAGVTDTEIVRYDKAPGVTPGLKLTIAAHNEVDLVPFLTSAGELTIEAAMNGGLPQNNWTTDITACLSTNARIDYLTGFGIKL